MNHYSEYTIQIVCKSKEKGVEKIIEVETKEIKKVNSILDLGLRHQEQIEILKKIQDEVLALQSPQLSEKINKCPKCGGKLQKRGYKESDFHSVYTDHKIKVQRQQCSKCKWNSIPSVKSLLRTAIHPDLSKLQCEMGAEHSYRDTQKILNAQSYVKRAINNHEQIHAIIEKVGSYIAETMDNENVKNIPVAKELIAQIDGGHIKDKEPDKRSFEAMTSIIYKPENIIKKGKKNVLVNKHCASSALSDGQEYMKKATLIAAKKQGLSKETEVTALCDGASNCWEIAESLKSYCGKFTGILDWFHIGMKFNNISLAKTQKEKLEKVRWCLWHGNVEKAFEKLDTLIGKVKNTSKVLKLSKLKNYISNNRQYIVNYNDRRDAKLPYTSHLAESTVESLINQRCKGQQHMRWSRIGLHYLLQIRAYFSGNDWNLNCMEKIMGSVKYA